MKRKDKIIEAREDNLIRSEMVLKYFKMEINQISSQRLQNTNKILDKLITTGVWVIVREAATDGVKWYRKKKFETFCLSVEGWGLGPVTTLLTNSSRIINATTRLHSVISFGAECLEDTGNLIFLPLDMALSGQPIPISGPDRFNIMTNFNDLLSD